MTWLSSTASTRRAKPSHLPWSEEAHQYQRRAVEHLTHNAVAALFLDPGLGKTSIVLEAFRRLKESSIAKRMLVVAPLRVCQTVWRQEGQKWTEFRDLRFSLLHGPKKAERLKDDADVWLINPEGVDWLCQQFEGKALPWDTVTIDELTKFKNPHAKRSKALRRRIERAQRKWGLTGTPAPNGLMDLFGQFLVLDNGAALGKYITHFRDQYFQVDFDGYSYNLMHGAEKRIEDRIRPYVLRMSAEEYLELPPIVDDVRELEMEPAARKTYDTMKKDMLAELPEGVVTGANAAAVYSKCKQMANGAVYLGDAKRTVSHIHDTKLEALDELREELVGQQLLIAYEFQHDIDRIKAHYGDALSVLGRGDTKDNETIAAWNRGELPLLACHPASAAHGLNLQYGGCGHVVWFSPIWDLELYQQFIRRIHRQGNEAQRIVNHLLCVKDTIDELALQALRDKDTTQARLLQSLNHEITGDERMAVQKLSRDGGTEAPRKLPKGWGAPATKEPTEADVVELVESEIVPDKEQRSSFGQRDRIRQTIAPQAIQQGEDGEAEEAEQVSLASKARSAFSPKVREKIAEVTGSHPQMNGSAGPSQPLQTDIEDFAPTAQPQRAADKPTPQAAPTKAKRQPAASVEALGNSARNVTEETQLRVALIQLANGDVSAARDMLNFINESP